MATKNPHRRIVQDADAESADPNLPAFLARPQGAPVYHGFPLLAESESCGWVFGVITDVPEDELTETGDAFVQAPDGSRAGIVWQVGEGGIEQILPPDQARWGVWCLWVPAEVRGVDELVAALRCFLPELKQIHAGARRG